MTEEYAGSFDIESTVIPDHLKEYIEVLSNARLPNAVEKDARQLRVDTVKKLARANDVIKRAADRRTRCVELIDHLSLRVDPLELIGHCSLPPKLLAKIFRLSLPDDFSITIPSVKARSRKVLQPWIFGHICSAWRQIALGEPLLWNRLDLVKPSQAHAPIIEAVIARSGKAPLQATITTSTALDVISLFVLPHAARFSQLTIRGTSQQTSTLLSLPGLFLSLERIMITNGDGNHQNHPDDSVTLVENKIRICEGSPKLIEVGLQITGNRHPLPAVTSFPLPLSRLKCLYLSTISPRIAIDMLKQTRNLESCTFTIGSEKDFYSLPPSGIRLPRLWQLSLTAADPMVGRAFIRHLTLPSLLLLIHTFDGTKDPYNISESSSPLIKLLERSACPLEYLRCNYRESTGRIFELAHSSIVAINTMDYGVLPATTVSKIAAGGWAPRLRLMACHIATLDVDDLLKMIETLYAEQAALPQAPSGKTPLPEWGFTLHPPMPWDLMFATEDRFTPWSIDIQQRCSALRHRFGIKGRLDIVPMPPPT